MRKLRGSLKLIHDRRRIKVKKKKNESYQLHKEYEDFDQAEKDLDLFVGDKHYYKCEKDCPVRMYLELDQESSTVKSCG